MEMWRLPIKGQSPENVSVKELKYTIKNIRKKSIWGQRALWHCQKTETRFKLKGTLFILKCIAHALHPLNYRLSLLRTEPQLFTTWERIDHRLSLREWAASVLNTFNTLPLGIDLLSERALNCNTVRCIDVENVYINAYILENTSMIPLAYS